MQEDKVNLLRVGCRDAASSKVILRLHAGGGYHFDLHIVEAVHLAIDPAGGGYAHHALDAFGFFDDLARCGRCVNDAAFFRYAGLVHFRHIFIKHFKDDLFGERRRIWRCAIFQQFGVQLGKSIGILLGDRLFLLKGRLDVGDR